MAEKSLGDPLAGFEIKEIILDEIKKRLDGDCTLAGGLAYAGFTAKFDIKIGFLRSLTKDTLVWGAASHYATEEVHMETVAETAIADSYTSPPPDIARQDHDLAIPVTVQTPKGPERRRVKIEKPVSARG